jgi:hypothetical protein
MNELNQLIDEQQNDNENGAILETTRMGTRTVTLSKSIVRYEERRPRRNGNDLDFIYLMGLESWQGSDHERFDQGKGMCPVCQGRKLRYNELCLCCCRSGADGRYEFKGLPVDYCRNEGWDDASDEQKPKATKYVKNTKLRGGLGN